NPLSPILTALSLMRMKRPGETTEHEQRIIERQTRHMVRLVDDLLDISRITRGVVALGRQRVEVAAVVAQAIETTSPLLESKRQRLALDVTPGLAIDADPDRIAQVIGNLLNNASRYSPPGACVHVSAHGPGESVVIEVRDEGEGLPPGAAEAIFEPFMQLDRSVSGARGGLGLGLAISRRLIELHGGVIRAHSDGPGRGSRFAVELPRVAAAAEPDEPVTVSMHAMMAPRSVLIVDDNEDAADTLADLLRTLGHQVQVAHDPPAALAVAEAFSPDIALLDIGLPVMDGYALAARLRERWSHGCKFVAVTGYGTSDDRRRSAAAGFDAHLVKPASLSDVLDALGEARGAACA
nr:ATP-binding protein [Burkholderiaceae bacterium]